MGSVPRISAGGVPSSESPTCRAAIDPTSSPSRVTAVSCAPSFADTSARLFPPLAKWAVILARVAPATVPRSEACVAAAPRAVISRGRGERARRRGARGRGLSRALSPQMDLQRAPRAAVAAKAEGEPVSGASMSRVRPTSLITSANSRHSFTFASNPAPTPHEKRSEPVRPNPSRRTHATAAAMGDAAPSPTPAPRRIADVVRMLRRYEHAAWTVSYAWKRRYSGCTLPG